ncbi:1-aminocyclopropane-1-carboxylate deaminase [Vibrio sp. UCD-FRSSP16_10]|uniref:1-aminocyclopropane-1-carboxylate deaminase/D-cysteine desulfhydrase n=1 Tax=unclassified Vibrio TaxID=2614977 RepID=UPI000800CD38|nr:MULTISPECIES: 1-aminocyclopropane-1-carboxylate deaminase/D-cysteine desulfhydrase [unclassified Vibrio]OBT13434.1 1-aminocyclopropane-1-carboxylate deaminase [Vibrio sp. UCD-FRSSP16_10]OBT17944.1 1-aminocyclopropane-1-carboxylate deaminase [Vibrio sp. UCD-FRSSP16_30]
MKLNTSPVTQHIFKNHSFYLKRDEQLHQHFSGNKARKFMRLLQEDYPGVDTLIGYGSIQANSLYSLAALCKIKKWKFEFYVHRIPQWLKDNPRGNYRGALDLGANIIECNSAEYDVLKENDLEGNLVKENAAEGNEQSIEPSHYIQHIRKPGANCLVIPEGGRSTLAEKGVQGLATEILDWTRYKPTKKFAIALPSGTGTTALYLHKHLKPHNIEVLTCACVGGDTYLREQWQELGMSDGPNILSCDYKHHFGKLYQQEYDVWQKLEKNTNVEFDLLYDPYMWNCLLPWMDNNPDVTVLYIHQGGILGNETMLPRYQRKFESVSS